MIVSLLLRLCESITVFGIDKQQEPTLGYYVDTSQSFGRKLLFPSVSIAAITVAVSTFRVWSTPSLLLYREHSRYCRLGAYTVQATQLLRFAIAFAITGVYSKRNFERAIILARYFERHSSFDATVNFS
jgi:hypothetical protein